MDYFNLHLYTHPLTLTVSSLVTSETTPPGGSFRVKVYTATTLETRQYAASLSPASDQPPTLAWHSDIMRSCSRFSACASSSDASSSTALAARDVGGVGPVVRCSRPFWKSTSTVKESSDLQPLAQAQSARAFAARPVCKLSTPRVAASGGRTRLAKIVASVDEEGGETGSKVNKSSLQTR